MKSGELSNLLNLPTSTLHKYASEDYAEYLSPTGSLGAGRHREYTEQDARILKLILKMKAERVKPDDIEATLSSLRASNWERLPALDEASSSIIPTPGALIAAGQRESAMQREIDVLREMLERADERTDEQIAKVTADRDALLERLHRAETMLSLYKDGSLRAPTHED